MTKSDKGFSMIDEAGRMINITLAWAGFARLAWETPLTECFVPFLAVAVIVWLMGLAEIVRRPHHREDPSAPGA